MQNRRVVITGIGLITPIGLNVQDNWHSILSSISGIRKITKFDTSNFSSRIAGVINHGQNLFIPENYIEPREVNRMDLFIQYGIAAAKEAIEDSGWKAETEIDQERTGVMIGSGIGGLDTIARTSLQLRDTGKVSPFFIPSCLINLLAGNVSIKYGFRGPNHAVVTACASGAHAIGDACRLIKYNDADVMVAGGSEAPICPLAIAGFATARALSTSYNDTPELASRPWDKGRDGFVIGEGSGVVVLEEYEHAKKRGAKIYAEVVGYGLSGDGYHITSPHPEGTGVINAMKFALKDAKIASKDVGYINAHGTSTPIGDLAEINAVQKLFYDENPGIKMSSTKSFIGHLLGGAGSVELIYTVLGLQNQIVPPTLNLEDQMDEAKIDLVPKEAKDHKFDYAISNSFGFGGTNACLVVKKI
jgi:3-oxoacyl-[acyl-carrier-protein] synthase II